MSSMITLATFFHEQNKRSHMYYSCERARACGMLCTSNQFSAEPIAVWTRSRVLATVAWRSEAERQWQLPERLRKVRMGVSEAADKNMMAVLQCVGVDRCACV